MNPEDLITLNEEIASMARAGLPLDQGLAALARDMARGRLQGVTAKLAADLKAGISLPEALERQKDRLPPYYAGLVKAGIRSGRITDVMATLTAYARALADVRSTVLGALFYPAVVLIFALGLFGFVCYFILPQFEQIFKDLQIRLPFVTEIALTVGRHPLEIIAFPFFVLVVGPILFRLLLGSRQGGRVAWARFVYAIPIFGTLVRSMRLAAFTDLLAILVEHELPLPEAFQLAGEASSDPVMAAAAGQVQHDLSLGMPLGEVLRTRLLVPELIAWMTRLGEQRGTLAKNLQQVAGIYRRQVEMRAAFLRTILPPFVIIATAGVLVTFFVFTIIMPMYKLLEGLSK